MVTETQPTDKASDMQQTPVVVKPVETKSDFRAFFEFPWTLYKDDPNWVPPLLSMRQELLDKKKNPAWDYMEGQYFAAWRGDKIVGTITAFINHRHNEFWDEHIGWFGTFEVYDDEEVAKALLDTAAEWVKSRGYDAIRGPQSFTTHEETGLLVDGFEPAVILMPYNPPYYAGLIEAAEYEQTMQIYSTYIDRDRLNEHDTLNMVNRMLKRVHRKYNLTVRSFDAKNKKADFQLIRDLYNEVWDKNWGFTPFTDRELDALVESLGMLVDPRFAFFAYIDDEPVGFSLAVPDFNQAIKAANPRPGVPDLLSQAQVFWNWKVRRTITGIRFFLFGVKEEYRGTGVSLIFIKSLLEAVVPTRFGYVDSSWVLETNPLMTMMEKLGADVYKTHRYYEKRFDNADSQTE